MNTAVREPIELLVVAPAQNAAERLNSALRNAGQAVRPAWVADAAACEAALIQRRPDLIYCYLANAAAELDEVARDLRAAAEGIQDDPERLQVLRERRQLLRDLRRKYGDSIAEVREFERQAAARLEETALKTYGILGCSGFARVDTIVDAAGTPWVLDVKTIPGFTETSTLPLAAEAAGMSFEELVETILDAALQSEAPAKL